MGRNTEIPFFRPSIDKSEITAVRRVLKSGWLTTGPETSAFETEFRDFLMNYNPDSPGGLQALAVNSATAGLHLALEAAGIGPGDRIAVPSLTFTASAEIIRYLGAHPVFVDSHPHTGNINPQKLREVAKSIRGVIPVHMAGHPCDMPGIRDALRGTDTVIVEDAAHAFPSFDDEGVLGTIGDIGVFSFYATKTITTGEGGMVVTRNEAYAKRMQLMRLHGIDREVWNRYRSGAALKLWEYDVLAPGYKYNMTDLAAALGRAQLKKARALHAERRRLAKRYIHELKGLDGLQLPPDHKGHAWHLFIIRFKDMNLRERIARALHRNAIGVSVHFIPLHRMTFWKNQYALDPKDFPVAENLADRILSLPLWPGMHKNDQKRIIKVIRTALNG